MRFPDLVREFSSVVGAGAISLDGAVPGFNAFGDADLDPADQFYYSIVNLANPAEREVGVGTFDGATITRDPLGGAAETDFSAGTKTVAIVAASEWLEQLEAIRLGGGGPDLTLYPITKPTRAALAAFTATNAAYLYEAGREGMFYKTATNIAALVAVDTQQAVYIPFSSDVTGASGGWVRALQTDLDLKWFGAAGTGLVDDKAAILAGQALSSSIKLPLSGRGRTYGLSGQLTVVSTWFKWRDSALKQLAPGANDSVVSVLVDKKIGVEFDNIKLDRNGDGTNGGWAATSGANGCITKAYGFKLKGQGGDYNNYNRLEVTGGDTGTGISANGFDLTTRLTNFHAHDMFGVNAAATDNNLQGIQIISCTGTIVEGMRSNDHQMTIGAYTGPDQTRGLSISLCSKMQFNGVAIRGAGEGLDCSGSGNHDIEINNSYVGFCWSWGFKVAGYSLRIYLNHCVGECNGNANFVDSCGQDNPGPVSWSDRNILTECIGINAGYNGAPVFGLLGGRNNNYADKSNFLALNGNNDTPTPVEWRDCVSKDDQATTPVDLRTVNIGFKSQKTHNLGAVAINCRSTGHKVSEFDSIRTLDVLSVADRSALAALTGSVRCCYLREAGREATFLWSSANLSAQVTADPTQLVYVAPAIDTTGASGAWVRQTVPDASLALAKLSNIAANSILGNNTGAAAAVSPLSGAQVTAMLSNFVGTTGAVDGVSGLVPGPAIANANKLLTANGWNNLSNTNIPVNTIGLNRLINASGAGFVSATAAGAWSERTVAQTITTLGLATVATSGSASDLTTGTLPVGQTPALSGGDVTKAAGSGVLTIGANKVTRGMLSAAAAAAILGATAAGNISDLTPTTVTGMLDTFTGAAKGVVPASGGGTAKFLRADGTWQAPKDSDYTGKVAGRYYSCYDKMVGAAGGVFSTTNMTLTPMIVQETMTLSELVARVVTVSAGGNFKLALYLADAATKMPTGNPVAQTGAMSTATAQVVTGALTANYQVTPGLYWVGQLVDNATATFAAYASSSVALAELLGNANAGQINTGGATWINNLRAPATYAGGFIDLTSAAFTPNASTSCLAPMYKVQSIP